MSRAGEVRGQKGGGGWTDCGREGEGRSELPAPEGTTSGSPGGESNPVLGEAATRGQWWVGLVQSGLTGESRRVGGTRWRAEASAGATASRVQVGKVRDGAGCDMSGTGQILGGDCSANLVEIWRQAGMGSSARTEGKFRGGEGNLWRGISCGRTTNLWAGEVKRGSHAERFRVGTHE